MRETKMMYEIILEYARKEQYMYLNYISFNNGFRLNNDTNFKVIEIQYSKPLGAFVLDFNNVTEKSSVIDTAKYIFMLLDKPFPIKRTQMVDERRIVLYPDNNIVNQLSKNPELMTSSLRFNVVNVRDVNNRPLDINESGDLFQFRELFVQQIFPGQNLPAGVPVVQKERPLSASPAKPKRDMQYWMNTPLKK
jgi:hypothetical protein